jgi:DNA-binding transcriptional LysR family regulator
MALEARLGVRLVERGPRRFTLTKEGIVQILNDLDDAEAETSVRAKAPRGRLRVGAPLETV